MAITMDRGEFSAINRQLCLRGTDIHSISEVALEMRNASDELELLSIARRMINTSQRNERALHNERNVELLKELICAQTETGDMLTTYSACELLGENNLDSNGAKYYALLAALDDLVNEGYLRRELMRCWHGNVHGSHTTVYIVNG